MIFNRDHIGKKVSYCGSSVIGKCEGTIVSMRPRVGQQPAWAVVKVDQKPDPWPYVGLDTFAPDLSKLTLLIPVRPHGRDCDDAARRRSS